MDIIILGDTHFKEGGIRPDKKGYLEQFYSDINRDDNRKKVLIIPGDILDTGGDGNIAFDANSKPSCITKSFNEMEEFHKFMKRINKNVEVVLCPGNHDTYFKSLKNHLLCRDYAMFNYIKNRYGSIYYSKVINGISFVSLGIYPDKKAIEFINKHAQTWEKIIFIFHYSLESNWWSDAEKEHFYFAIEPYKSKVIGIVFGHIHNTEIKMIHDLKTFNGSGVNYLKIRSEEI
jgi:UDP-2,3-diacylglucosamine pyrophosphatase LpxH